MDNSFTRLDKLFSFFVLFTIVVLALYMVVRLGTQAILFVEHVFSGMYMDMDFMEAHSKRVLHSIAEVIVLIKAYRILVSYVHTHHVSVEYIVEISIVATAVELLFAVDTHSVPNNIVLAAFGLINLFAYLHYFGPEHDEGLHKALRKGKKNKESIV